MNLKKHTMGKSLLRYLDIKIHPDLKSNKYDEIIIRGSVKRLQSGISSIEKNDKLLNWKRPSIEKITPRKCYYNCFPGQDYIFHYFKLLTTYYELHKDKYHLVKMIPCSKKRTFESLIKYTNIMQVPKANIYIIGIVHHFFDKDEFIGDGDFIWKHLKVNNKEIIYLGCKFSIWGNIAGEVARCLAHKGAESVIYIGKLGGLKKKFTPNSLICTGNTSFVRKQNIVWNNFFDDISNKILVYGKHITVPSVIQETKEWLNKNEKNFDFVDPEIGCVAKVCSEEKINFSYLDIISDNLKCKYDEDLSNERDSKIIAKREDLYSVMRNILKTKGLME